MFGANTRRRCCGLPLPRTGEMDGHPLGTAMTGRTLEQTGYIRQAAVGGLDAAAAEWDLEPGQRDEAGCRERGGTGGRAMAGAIHLDSLWT